MAASAEHWFLNDCSPPNKVVQSQTLGTAPRDATAKDMQKLDEHEAALYTRSSHVRITYNVASGKRTSRTGTRQERPERVKGQASSLATSVMLELGLGRGPSSIPSAEAWRRYVTSLPGPLYLIRDFSQRFFRRQEPIKTILLDSYVQTRIKAWIESHKCLDVNQSACPNGPHNIDPQRRLFLSRRDVKIPEPQIHCAMLPVIVRLR